MKSSSDHVPVVFRLARMEWVDSKESPDPEHLIKWERSLQQLGLELRAGGPLSCSVTYPDGGPPTCDDHDPTSAFLSHETNVTPAIIAVQPDVMREVRSPEALEQWERKMSKHYGLQRLENAGSTTETETRPDSGMADCDIKGDEPVA